MYTRYFQMQSNLNVQWSKYRTGTTPSTPIQYSIGLIPTYKIFARDSPVSDKICIDFIHSYLMRWMFSCISVAAHTYNHIHHFLISIYVFEFCICIHSYFPYFPYCKHSYINILAEPQTVYLFKKKRTEVPAYVAIMNDFPLWLGPIWPSHP